MIREHQTMILDQEAMLRNQQASIHNIEKQLGQLAQQINHRAPGELPSNTEKNPRMAHINAITTNSDKSFVPLSPIQKDAKKVQAEKAEKSKLIEPDSTRRVPYKDSTSPRHVDKTSCLLKLYRPPFPFPSRATPDEQIQGYRKFMEHVKALQVNIPFVETILQMPTYACLLKGLFTARNDMAEIAELVLKELPEKRGDPVDVHESTLTLRVGDDSVIFKAVQEKKNEEIRKDKTSSMDLMTNY
uniref:Uncharacterized protein n=1 Tax=Lactuca sativa TaxID=4236 RepID=A0A9R1UCC3_LACSA|nr:hypothetical protein LSAT_V11C900485800 [Lactuca sativa]